MKAAEKNAKRRAHYNHLERAVDAEAAKRFHEPTYSQRIAFSGRLLPKQKPEQHKDSTLVMLQHIEDPEAWEKIYKLVNVLWLKEATYRTVELEKGVKKA